jgi:hypothetical protein
MDVVEGKLTFTAEDLQRGLAQMPENVVVNRWLQAYAGLLIVAGAAGFMDAMLGLRLLWIVIGLGLMVWAPLRTRRAGERLLAGMQNGARDVSYRFDAQGMNIQTPVSDVSLRYGALHRQREVSTAFLLYTQDHVAQIIPKRAFDAAQLEQLRRWFTGAVQERPRPKTFRRTLVIWAVLLLFFLIVWQWVLPVR